MKALETRIGGLYRIHYSPGLRFGSGHMCDTLRAFSFKAQSARDYLVPRGSILLITGHTQPTDKDEGCFHFIMDEMHLWANDSRYFDFEELLETE